MPQPPTLSEIITDLTKRGMSGWHASICADAVVAWVEKACAEGRDHG